VAIVKRGVAGHLFLVPDDALSVAWFSEPKDSPKVNQATSYNARPGDPTPADPAPPPPAQAPAPTVWSTDHFTPEFHRAQDAVRDAGREHQAMSGGDVREFIKARAASPEAVDPEAFLRHAREQRHTDLGDVLDAKMRRGNPLVDRNRTAVRVTAPRGWVQRTISDMSLEEADALGDRLIARGHSSANVQKHLLDKLPKSKMEPSGYTNPS
jgi:hypothetical protein